VLAPIHKLGGDNYGTAAFSTGTSAGYFTSNPIKSITSTYSGHSTDSSFAGVDFADFLLGLPYQSANSAIQQDSDGTNKHYQAFVLDTWKLNDRMTITWGVSYGLHPGYVEKNGNMANLDTRPIYRWIGHVVYPQGKQSKLSTTYLNAVNAYDPDGITYASTCTTTNGVSCIAVDGNETSKLPSDLRQYSKFRLMPHVGFNYRPTDSGKWIIHAGAGFYHADMLGESSNGLAGAAQSGTQVYTNDYARYETASSSGVVSATAWYTGFQWPNSYCNTGTTNKSCSYKQTTAYGMNYFGLASQVNWKDPYVAQWSFGAEHELSEGYTARATYIGSVGRQLVWEPDMNSTPFNSTTAANAVGIKARYFPMWGRIDTLATGANSIYSALQFNLNHRMQKGFEFNTTFTWATSFADNQGALGNSYASDNGGTLSTSYQNRYADRGNVSSDRRLRWLTTGVYDLPFGRGKLIGANSNRILNNVIGGWRLSGILTIQSGDYLTPYFPAGQGDPSGTGSGLIASTYVPADRTSTTSGSYLYYTTSSTASYDPSHRAQHPDRVAGIKHNPTNRSRNNWINSAAFTCPGDSTWTVGNACTTGNGMGTATTATPIGRFGNAGVGSVQGPGLFNLDAGLTKTLYINERFKVKGQGTFTNVFNRANLGDPIMDLSSPNFGKILSAAGSDFGGARTGQVAVRFEF